MRRFSFTTLAMVMMAILANPDSDPQRFDADLSPAAAAMMSGATDSSASANG
ncbi:hypothetical protein H9L13_04475 [Sphingomonas lutea]|uniref:Uncharacterized protein n=1 Tax=Sphingomonas lutea TaxID=1045317 RepID=A0A7G9SJX2_9SPHN|nr:hypothetical protein [Sphingomonas lutea]QNN68147.1 hypothetical protein H9L13_04475 [Sphingomonas lutea]